jgi:hypothetical protein
MQKTLLSRQRLHERGQTILLVAVSLVSLLAMAALAIDVVTLYVARTEIQRAADAAALAAAKAIADSGVTTLQISPPDPNLTAAQSLAQTMATTAVTSLLSAPAINLVAGNAPTLTTLTPIPIDWSRQGNPHVTISLKASNLPTFFSKIWGGSPASVTATATAEAYNPANLPTTTITSITPIAPTSVKPWLVANINPVDSLPFVNTSTWVVDSSIIGGPSIDLVSDCTHPGPNKCRPLSNPPGIVPGPTSTPQVQYVPAVVTTPNTQNVCPACAGGTDYEQSIGCADVATSYQVLNCGGGTAQIQWDDGINPGPSPGTNATSLGGQCLIHASSEGAGGQDVLTEPSTIFSAPYQIKQQSGTLVTTSNSIVTIPILDRTALPHGGGTVTVDGFLQAFINQVDGPPLGPGQPPEGSINITVLNIVGCSTVNNGANPVIGGSGTSPVPVRLIAP